MDSNTDNINIAMKLFFRGTSLNQIAKQSGINKKQLQTLIKSEKWKTIYSISKKLYIRFEDKEQIPDFLFWFLGTKRNRFLTVAELALNYDDKTEHQTPCEIKSGLDLLRAIYSNITGCLINFLIYLYEQNKDLYNEVYEAAAVFDRELESITKIK
jgi:lambda repressor-like predicted transcriptional regulator